MAKVKAKTELSPSNFTAGSVVKASDALEVLEQANWSAAESFETFLRWDYRPDAQGLTYLGSGEVTYFRNRVYVPPHAQAIAVTLSTTLASGSHTTGRCRVYVGAGTLTMDRTSTGASLATISTGTTGTGFVNLRVSLERTAGTGTIRLDSIQVRTGVIAATNLLSPIDE